MHSTKYILGEMFVQDAYIKGEIYAKMSIFILLKKHLVLKCDAIDL